MSDDPFWVDIDGERTGRTEPAAEPEPEPDTAPEGDLELTPEEPIQWSEKQLLRLESECRLLQRSFAWHPTVTVQPMQGDPPTEYRIDLRVRTLLLDDAGQLQYANTAPIHIWIGPGFPEQPPLVRPMASLFHPNVAMDGIACTSDWSPPQHLADLVGKVGEMLAYRTYDPDAVVNHAALQWLSTNFTQLPLDRHASFAPSAGGDPLLRIERHGAGALVRIRQSLTGFQDALLRPGVPPDPAQVQGFAQQTRVALNLFLDADVPDGLRLLASELDDAARELAASVPAWEFLRRRRDEIGALRKSMASATEARGPLLRILAELAGMDLGAAPVDPALALHSIPDAITLRPLRLKLPELIHGTSEQAAALRAAMAPFDTAPPQVPVTAESLVGQRLSAEQAATDQVQATTLQLAREALQSLEAALQRGQAELMALEQVAGWRDYADLLERARTLERRVAEWGSGGVHACFVAGEPDAGPFQFEQPLEVGARRLAVRSSGRGRIQLVDADTFDRIASSTDSAVSIEVPDEQTGEPMPITFRLSDRCEDLLINFDFLRKQTVENLMEVRAGADPSQTGFGRVASFLAQPAMRARLQQDLGRRVQSWTTIMLDLASLLPFKQRLATYYLAQRVAEQLPRWADELSQARKQVREVEQRLTEIVGRCSRDIENDRLIIPPKFAKEYPAALARRDALHETIATLQRRSAEAAGQLHDRLQSRRLRGRSDHPGGRALAPLPADLAELSMTDAELLSLLAPLEERCGIALGLDALAPPPEIPAAEEVPAGDEAAPGDEAERVSESEDSVELLISDVTQGEPSADGVDDTFPADDDTIVAPEDGDHRADS